MKKLLIAVFAAAVACSPIVGVKQPPSYLDARQTQPNEADLESHGHYRNRDGEEVYSPSRSKSGKVPQGGICAVQ